MVDASEIHTYKSMLSIAFSYLASKTIGNITKNLLTDISMNEANDADDWNKIMKDINEGKPQKPAAYLRQRVRLMMIILGPRNFLEWVLIAEDESIEGITIKVGNIQDKETSDTLTRIVSDERLHVNNMKKEVLG